MLVYSFLVAQDQNWRIGQYLVLSIFWNKVYIQEVLLNLCLKYYASFVITCIAFTCMYAIFFFRIYITLAWRSSLFINYLFSFHFQIHQYSNILV